MQNEWLGLTAALYGDFHRVAWPSVDIGLVGTNVCVECSPIHGDNAVAGAQPGALGGASLYHIFNWLPVHFVVIRRVVDFIEAELYLRERTHGVHPDGTVGDRYHGQQNRPCCQERFFER